MDTRDPADPVACGDSALVSLEAMRQREEQYRAIFEATQDGLFLWDESLRIADVNPAGLALYGYRRDELIGQTYPPSMPKEYVDHRLALVRRALAGETAHLETTVLRPDGSTFDADLRVLPFRHGGRPHALAVVRDISERRGRERELQRSEARLRATVEAAFDCVIGMDPQGRIVEFNTTATRVFGWRRRDVLGQSALVLLPERLHDAYRRELRTFHERGVDSASARLMESVMLRADGTEVPVELALSVAGDADASVLVCHVRDITQRRREERVLRDSEEQYRAIFNASADSLVLRDAQFRIVDVNATYEVMSGYTRAEVLGLDRVVANPPEVAAHLRTLHAKALAGEIVRLETQLVRRDGALYDLELRGVPILHRGEPHVLYIGRDISDRVREGRQRAELERQLRQAQKMEAIGQLTGGLAHDFNNILTSVLGYIAMAQERPAASADAALAHELAQARLAADRAREHVAQLLAFSRPQRGERRLLMPSDMTAEAVLLLRPNLPASIAVDTAGTEGALDVPPVLADPVQFEQVLFNLFINARDAIGGHGTIRVAIAHGTAEGHCASCGAGLDGSRWVAFEVTDDGRGMTRDVLDRMFEPFFTTKEVGRGTGMGLAMVHGIVHDHGGHIQVRSSPGRGSSFHVLLPAAEQEPAPGPALAAPAPAATHPPLRGRVLLVEDESVVSGYMQDLLGGWGLEVVLESEPLAAARRLARTQEEPFALMLSDQTMPGMTGLALARQARLHRPALPVVLYTGCGTALDKHELQQSGVAALIRKPVDAEGLRALLVDLLELAHEAG